MLRITARAGNAFVVIAIVILAWGAVATAGHVFSDIPAGSLLHAATEWMRDRGITLGCAAGVYCPDDLVTRGQLALFLERMGGAMTPRLLDAVFALGTVDLDTMPVVCQTASYTPSFAQTAMLLARADGLGTVAGNYRLHTVFSVDDGANWTSASPGLANIIQVGPGVRGFGMHYGHIDLAPGTRYVFGAQLRRHGGGTANLTDAACGLHAQIVNRNPAAPPLSIRGGRVGSGRDAR